MLFQGKIKTIKDGLAIMKWGADLRSKKILFYTDLLNNLGHSRKGMRNWVASQIKAKDTEQVIELNIKIRTGSIIPVKYRLNDFCDYQSVGECFGDMYDVPEHHIEYMLDAGANLGFFSLSMLNRFQLKEVIAIEPNPYNLGMLAFNLSQFKNCSIRPVALSNKHGEVVFELAGSNTGHIRGSIGHETTSNTVNVELAILSSIIPQHWDMNKTLLKIDIEGAEYDVLPELLSKNYLPRIIVGELHDYFNGGEKLIDELKLKGYSVTVTGFGHTGNVCRQITATR